MKLWYKFEAWVAGKFPGWKTKGLNLLAAVGNVATILVAYINSIPLASLIEVKTLMVLLLVLNTLSFWLKDITERVEARKDSL